MDIFRNHTQNQRVNNKFFQKIYQTLTSQHEYVSELKSN